MANDLIVLLTKYIFIIKNYEKLFFLTVIAVFSPFLFSCQRYTMRDKCATKQLTKKKKKKIIKTLLYLTQKALKGI